VFELFDRLIQLNGSDVAKGAHDVAPDVDGKRSSHGASVGAAGRHLTATTKMIDREKIAFEGLCISAITFCVLETAYAIDEICTAPGRKSSRRRGTRLVGEFSC
jgi:hypothetical protein